jgi:hypothetical protein
MKNLYKIENDLYIISTSEDIIENDWIITDNRLVQVSYLLSNEVAKGNKIILTSNKLLIADGIQAIDDEFLEWFVKNPSCEFVKVKSESSRKFGMWKPEYYPKIYKIIIPQEEPIIVRLPTYYETKQETPEEAAEKRIPTSTKVWDLTETRRNDFIAGTKWQAETMYSEEDLRNAYRWGTLVNQGTKEHFNEWFEQFKKK